MSEIFDRIVLPTTNPKQYMLRGLKGGRGGGGSRGSSGGGYSSGGGGYNSGYNNNNNNCYGDDCNDDDDAPNWLIALIFILIILAVVCVAILAKKCKDEDEKKRQITAQPVKDAKGGDFESRVQNARSDYEGYFASKGSGTEGEGVPQSGTYIATFVDRGKTSDGKVTLTFKESDDGKGYMITGTSNDDDGDAVIDEGYVSFDGMKAWWKDRCVTGDVGMVVLTEGSFNFKTNTFMGKWISSSGAEGHFTRFSLKGSASASGGHGQTQTQAPEGSPDKVYNLGQAEAEFAVYPSAPPPASTYTADVYKPGAVQPSAPTTTTTSTTANNGSTGAAPSLFDQMMGGMKK